MKTPKHKPTRRIAAFGCLATICIVSASVAGYLGYGHGRELQTLSSQVLAHAEQLDTMSRGPVLDSLAANRLLAEMKALIQQYEQTMVLAASPYPGEILLGTTPPGDSTWLEMLCDTRYSGLIKEIRLRRTGNHARYLRINDIEITGRTRRGPVRHTLNKNGRDKLYGNGVFRLALPAPMIVHRIRIHINHESAGLQVTGVPQHPSAFHGSTLNLNLPNAPAFVQAVPEEVLLGTTPPGDSTWLETLCSNPYHQPVRELRIKRTGHKASYLRINDIEVSYHTPRGPRTETFNRNGRKKLYSAGTFRLPLPHPMRIARVRVLINHESTGLELYGVH